MSVCTTGELLEARRSIASTLSKCEKAILKLQPGKSQYTLTVRRIAAFRIALDLIDKELNSMTIRMEEPKDYREVENLTREAFWNKYHPGCMEHYVLHCYRDRPEFVKELDYVAEEDGKIIAHIMYSRAQITTDDGQTVPVMIFGPVSVLPEKQGRGYGSRLIRYTLELAEKMDCGAVAITGDPEYYHRFGFASGSALGVYYDGIPRSEEAPFFMVKELKEGFLRGVTGVYKDPEGYFVEDADVDTFDEDFPPKEKKKLPGQLM